MHQIPMHLYLLLHNKTLTEAQAADAVARLIAKAVSSVQPDEIPHSAVNDDGSQAIYEALWDEALFTEAAFAREMDAVLGLTAGTVTITEEPGGAYGPAWPFMHGALEVARLTLFGGRAATAAQSRAQAQAYMATASWVPRTAPPA